MTKCKLCQSNQADQLNSHITSCFMVASMIGERDLENGYIIGTDSEDHTKNVGADPIKEDFIFCRGCESRLSYLEGYFAKEFTAKVDSITHVGNFEVFKSPCEYLLPSQVNSVAFHLLISSVIWRAHLSTKSLFKNFTIPSEASEHIRLTLDTVLPEYDNYRVKGKYKDWIKGLIAMKEEVSFYPYVLFRADLESTDRTENLIFFDDREKNPYHFIINEFIGMIYFDNVTITDPVSFFRLKEKYDIDCLKMTSVDEIKVARLELEDWRDIRDRLYHHILKYKSFRYIISECVRIARSNGIFPSVKYMKHCIECHESHKSIEM